MIRLATTTLFFLGLGLYIFTLAPSVVTIFDDSLEFQLVTYQLGIAHPTGYPLYTLLGKLFTFLPVGDIAYRVNFLSAFWGAMTIALLYRLIYRLLKSEIESFSSKFLSSQDSLIHVGAGGGALLLIVSPIFWQQATIAEVYTLNAFFVVLLLERTISFNKQRSLIWLALIMGLSLTHHRTIVLLWPSLGLYLLFTHRAILFKPKWLIGGLLAFLFPLLLYLYLPLRGHIGSLDGTYQNNWAGFWQQVTASGYSLFIFDNPFQQERDFVFYLNLLTEQFYILVPGLIGFFYLLRLNGRKTILLALAFLTYFTFNIFYQVADIEPFFIPVFLIWAVWSGIGITFLLQWIAPLSKGRVPLFLTVGGLFFFILYQQIQATYSFLEQQYSWQVHDYGLDMIDHLPLESKNPTVVGLLGEMTLIRYFQQTENLRPDVETVVADDEAIRLATVEQLLNEDKMVYLTRPLPGAAERWSLGAEGPLIRVYPDPPLQPPELTQVEKTLTPNILLRGYQLTRLLRTEPDSTLLRLTVVWQPIHPPTMSLKISARLLNAQKEMIAVVDTIPVHFAYPTTAWRSNEFITDIYDFVLSEEDVSDSYTLLLIGYDPAQNAAEIGRIELESITAN